MNQQSMLEFQEFEGGLPAPPPRIRGRWIRRGNAIVVLLDEPMPAEGRARVATPAFEFSPELGEFETGTQKRYIYADAYWLRPDGAYQFLEKVGPVLETRAFVETARSTLRLKWYPRTQGQSGGRLDIRCLAWNGREWLDCARYSF